MSSLLTIAKYVFNGNKTLGTRHLTWKLSKIFMIIKNVAHSLIHFIVMEIKGQNG